MAELTIKLFGREVTLANTKANEEYFKATLGPFLELIWSRMTLTLWVRERPVAPAATADTIELAVAKLEEAHGPLRQLFRTWERAPGTKADKAIGKEVTLLDLLDEIDALKLRNFDLQQSLRVRDERLTELEAAKGAPRG